MTDAIPLDEWLRRIDDEYLSGFVRDGGAAVKLAVTPDEARPVLRDALEQRCRESGYLFAALDAAELRAHMPQDVFFGLARQIDWRGLARRRVLRLAAERRYRVDTIDPAGGGDVFDAIAGANDLEPQTVLMRLRPDIEARVFKHAAMARDFRAAMTFLCEQTGDRPDGSYEGQPVLDWLTGADTRLSPVRPFLIHTAVNRATARHFIESALHWVREAGHAGTVVLLDNRRVMVARNPRDGLRYYTRAMTVDHYELLREFIDGVDRLAGALLVVATGDRFLDDEAGRGSRGFGIYEALKTRVMNDVRDRRLLNPVAALVRLSQPDARRDDGEEREPASGAEGPGDERRAGPPPSAPSGGLAGAVVAARRAARWFATNGS